MKSRVDFNRMSWYLKEFYFRINIHKNKKQKTYQNTKFYIINMLKTKKNVKKRLDRDVQMLS